MRACCACVRAVRVCCACVLGVCVLTLEDPQELAHVAVPDIDVVLGLLRRPPDDEVAPPGREAARLPLRMGVGMWQGVCAGCVCVWGGDEGAAAGRGQ